MTHFVATMTQPCSQGAQLRCVGKARTPPQRLQTIYCISAPGWPTLPDEAFLYDLDEDILFRVDVAFVVPDFSRVSVNFAEVSII
ncbi:hypothetical protein [Bradyrhizobium sp. USDA 4452]